MVSSFFLTLIANGRYKLAVFLLMRYLAVRVILVIGTVALKCEVTILWHRRCCSRMNMLDATQLHVVVDRVYHYLLDQSILCAASLAARLLSNSEIVGRARGRYQSFLLTAQRLFIACTICVALYCSVHSHHICYGNSLFHSVCLLKLRRFLSHHPSERLSCLQKQHSIVVLSVTSNVFVDHLPLFMDPVCRLPIGISSICCWILRLSVQFILFLLDFKCRMDTFRSIFSHLQGRIRSPPLFPPCDLHVAFIHVAQYS